MIIERGIGINHVACDLKSDYLGVNRGFTTYEQ